MAAMTRPRTRPIVLAAVSLWRLLIAASALTGFGLCLDGEPANLAFLTLQGNLATGLGYLVLLGYPLVTRGRAHEPGTRWVRGALTLLMLLICVTYLTMLGGDLSAPRDLLAHLLTPLLVFVDWAAVGSSQTSCRWWYPLSWLLPPLAYLGFYVGYGHVLYPFLDPGRADFLPVVGGFLVGVLATGYLLYGLATLRGRLAPATT